MSNPKPEEVRETPVKKTTELYSFNEQKPSAELRIPNFSEKEHLPMQQFPSLPFQMFPHPQNPAMFLPPNIDPMAFVRLS